MQEGKSIRSLTGFWLAIILSGALVANRLPDQHEQFLVTHGDIGQYGGKLVISQRAEPKTLNPVIAIDEGSRAIIGLITADLIHINRLSQETEPSLASSWTVSKDGREYVLRLRHGLRFSDGQLFDANDVVFTFQVYLDQKIHSPQRDLLVIAGRPIEVKKIDAYTVRFSLEQPYAAAERLFDSIAILPQHLLRDAYEKGRLAESLTHQYCARSNRRVRSVSSEAIRSRTADYPGA